MSKAISIRHFVRVDDSGKVIYLNSELWFQQLAQLRGKDAEIIIKERVKKPSHSQYNFYFGAILNVCWESELFKHFDKAEDIHEMYFAPKFLGYTKVAEVGNTRIVHSKVKSLASLSREEVSEFIERVIAHCNADLGIEVLSSESYHNKFYDVF